MKQMQANLMLPASERDSPNQSRIDIVKILYRQNFSDEIDEWLGDDDILDLRAEFYEKFYRIQKPFATFKFLKNGKVVSHYAKAYRGIVLRQVAQNWVKNFSELCKTDIENLRLIDIKKTGLKSEFLVQIV